MHPCELSSRLRPVVRGVPLMSLSVACALTLTVSVMLAGQVHSLTYSQSDTDLSQDDRYKLGKERYELIKKESRMPKYSRCWTGALHSLEAGCKQLTDDAQHRLALAFANCFLDKTGRPTYPCDENHDLDVCTKDMASEAYNTYTEFFTHTQNICFFLQAQAWQEETETTITKLHDSSAVVAEQIEASSNLQGEMMKRQNESIKNQEILIERGSELKRTLEESSVDVHQMLEEFKSTTTEQRALIFEVFDKVNSLQSIVMGEFTGFYSLIFYTISILVGYLLTSTPRTSGARFWIFVVMTANMIIERMIVMWGVEQFQDGNGQIVDENTQLYARLWICRKVFTTVAVSSWVWCAYRFQDLNHINNKLLVEIRKQNSDLKHMLQSGSQPSTPVKPALLPPSRSLPDPVLLTQRLNSTAVRLGHQVNRTMTNLEDDSINFQLEKIESSSTGYGSDTETNSDSSLSSQLSDHTFVLDRESSDAESFMTGSSFRYSRESTPSLLDELRFLRESTPLRELGSAFGLMNASAAGVSSLDTSVAKKRGRPRGRKSAPVLTTPCKYNLRSRMGKTAQCDNPVVQTESALDFGRIVKHLSQVAQRNSTKAAESVERRNTHSNLDTSMLLNGAFQGDISSISNHGDGPRIFSSDED